MKKLFTLSICALLFLSGVTYVLGFNAGLSTAPKTQENTPHELVFDDDKLWSLINAYRQNSHLPTLIKDQNLCKVAQERVLEINSEIKSPHAGFFQRYGYGRTDISENNTGAYNTQDAFSRWIASPPHRRNIEGDWKYSCVVCSIQKVGCVQLFANFQ